jgi:restriction system protein
VAGGQAARAAQVTRVDRVTQAARSGLPPARVRQVRRVTRPLELVRQEQPRQEQQRRHEQQQRQQRRQEQQQRRQESQPRQEQQRRIWQRTAAKRAARQVETEQAILEREERLREPRPPAPPEDEPETYEGYVRRRTAEAREATVAAGGRSAALDDMWTTALASPLHVSFGSLRRKVTPVPFDAGDLAMPLAEPQAADFQPAGAVLPSWLPGQRAARERARQAAYAEYRQAMAEHRAAEYDRVRRLSVARLEHQQRENAVAAEANAHNVTVDRLRAGYREHDPAAVEEFARIVLSARSWPEGVMLRWRLNYRPDYCQIDAECVLPGPEIVPGVRRYRYVAAADAIRRQLVPAEELRRRYDAAVEQIALVALFDLFHALAPDVVDVVHLNGRLSAPPPEPEPPLVSVAAARSEWDALPLPAEPPADLLRRLDARVSLSPYDAVPVVPW